MDRPLPPPPSSSVDSSGPPIDLAKYYKDAGLPVFSDNDASGLAERKYLALSSSSSDSEDSPFAGLRGVALDMGGLEGQGPGLRHKSMEELEDR